MKRTETINLQQLREEYKVKIIEFLNGKEVELKFDFAPFDIIVSMIEQILLELNYKADYDYVQNTKNLGNFTCYTIFKNESTAACLTLTCGAYINLCKYNVLDTLNKEETQVENNVVQKKEKGSTKI